MSNDTAGPVLPHDAAGSGSLGAVVWRLYRHNALWRGAVDMILIGVLVMHLTGGVAARKPVDPGIKPATAPSASFSPAAPVAARALPALPAPENKDQMTFEWTAGVSDKDIEILQSAISLISVENEKAKTMLGEKATQGNPDYQAVLGAVYINQWMQGKSTEDFDHAIALYKAAAIQGQPTAQWQLGRLFETEFPNRAAQPAEAWKWYRMCVQNPLGKSGECEYYLGKLYRSDKAPGGRNGELGLRFLRKAAEKGHIYALHGLGTMFSGAGGTIREKRQMIMTAAMKGDAPSQLVLATKYLDGDLTGRPDYGQFLTWAGLAADQGMVEAMMQLGHFHRRGAPGFPADTYAARRHYQRAVGAGNVQAMILLGKMLRDGDGGEKDPTRAYTLFLLAAKNGNRDAADAALKMEKVLPPAEAEAARKLADDIPFPTPKGTGKMP